MTKSAPGTPARKPEGASLSFRSRRTRRFLLGGLALGLALMGSQPEAQAQSRIASGNQSNASSENGMGMIGRMGHLGFKTFGRDESITPLEIMPYLMEDEHFFFGDFRGFLSNDGLFGGNVGLGYRYLDEGMMSWYGANVWYDGDDTTGHYFQQIGFGLEAIIEVVELRANFYLPVGDTEQQFSSGTYATRFVGNQLLFDSTSRYGSAMKGVDVEAGSFIPVPLGPYLSDLRGFVGGYFFDGNGVDTITGFKARAELAVNNTVTTQVLYTNDGTFGSNVMVGAQVEFPWGGAHPNAGWKRAMPSPYRYVERNYNVIVGQRQSEIRDVVAINPETGLAYEVQHVSGSGTAGGTGTVDSTWATVAQAQAAGADIVFVHSGTTLSENITVQNGQFVLGEGTTQTIVAQGYGPLSMPGTTNGGSISTPRLTGITGDAVTLGDKSVFSGFQLDNITGNGIVASGKSNFGIRDVQFGSISGAGINLLNSGGAVNLTNLNFGATTGRGLVISGGNANIVASASTFNQVAGDAITLENTTGGSIELLGMNIQNSGARGLVGENLQSRVRTNNLTINQIAGDAIVMDGSTEAVNFDGVTTITNSQARGVVLSNLNPVEVANVTKEITFNDLRITSTAAHAAVTLDNNEGDVVINKMALDLKNGTGLLVRDSDSVTIKNGAISTTNAAAADIEDSNTDIKLTSLSVDGGAVGLRIVDSTGSFVVNGNNKLASGGVIKNTTNAVILDNAGTVGLRFMDLVSNTNGIKSESTDYVVLDYMRITQTTNYAIDSKNDSLHSISNSLITGNGALGGGSIRYQADAFGSYTAQILNSTIVDNNGTPISYQGLTGSEGASLNFLMSNNVIQANRGGMSAVDIDWNGPAGVTITGTEFTLAESNQKAVDITGTSTTDRLTGQFVSNIINSDGTGNTGFHIKAAGTSTLQFGGNGIVFNEANGVGMRFDLAGASSTLFDSNTIIDNDAGGTGILFDYIAGGSTVQFDANSIQLKSTGLVVDRGIIFTSMGETVELRGTRNNVVTGATTPFSAPSGKTTGGFRLNGSIVP